MKIAFKILLLSFFLSETAAQTTTQDSLTAILPKLPNGNEKIEVLSKLLKLSLNSDLEKSRNYGYQILGLSKKTGNNLALATAYKDLGVTHIIASNFDSSRYYYSLAIREYEKLIQRNDGADQNKILEGYVGTLANIGNWHYYKSDLDSALQYHLRAADLSKQSSIEKVEANSLSTMSYIYMDQEKYDKAIAMQFEALHTFERLKDQDGISRSYQGIGEINCEYLDKCQLALDYYRRALTIKKSMGSERGMAYVFRSIGDAHSQLSAIDSANFYFEKSVELAEKLDDKRLLVDGYSALASIASQLGKPIEERIEINQKFIEVAKEIGRLDALCVGYNNLASIYDEQGNMDKAIAYYHQAIPLALEQKDFQILQKANYALYGIYKNQLHHPAKALEALEAYLVNHDSVTNSERFRAVEDISTQYETAKKEATIVQQEEAIRQGRTRFWLITGILTLALAGGALLFRLTRILRKRNEEKEFLIKEIHHRVKNNLQVLSSLLHLQSRHIKDDAALDAVREGQNRVEAMGLIHQKLYMGDNLAAVEMQDYLHNLGDTLLDAFRLDDDRVKIIYHLEPLHLDVDTAIPLGLIINELVTNSLKYAFPDGREGTVEISLWKNEIGKLSLKVADDGVGKNGAPELKSSTSFGTNLVHILSKKLKGVPQVLEGEGYATLIEFGNFKEAKK